MARARSRSRTRTSTPGMRLLAGLLAGTLAIAGFGVVSQGASAAPTDGTLPAIDDFTMDADEIGQDQSTAAVITGQFAPSEAGGGDPTVEILDGSSVDATISFDVLAWDDDQIFGSLKTSGSTVRGLKDVQVVQSLPTGEDGSDTHSNAFRVGFEPVISSVSPMSMVIEDGATVTITGSKFESGAAAELKKGSEVVTPSSLSVNTDGTEITATFDPDTTLHLGSWTLRVDNPAAGTHDTLSGFQLTGASAPSVSSVSGDSQIGQGASGAQVTIDGSGFYEGVDVAASGSGVNISSLVRVDSTQLEFQVSAGDSAAAGLRDLIITNADGQQTTTTDAIQVIVRPRIDADQQFTAPQGVRRHPIVVTGSGFRSDTTVTFSDPSGTTDKLSADRVRVVSGDLEIVVNVEEGAELDEQYGIRLENPGGGSDTCETSAETSECVTLTPGPRVNSVQPSTVRPGDVVTLQIEGERFLPLRPTPSPGLAFPRVIFDNDDIEIVGSVGYSPTNLTVPIEVASDASDADVTVTVENPDGGRGSCPTCLSISSTS